MKWRDITTDGILNIVQVRVVGSGHSPSEIACTDEYMLSLATYNAILSVDDDLVTFQAGATIEQLNEVCVVLCWYGIIPKLAIVNV